MGVFDVFSTSPASRACRMLWAVLPALLLAVWPVVAAAQSSADAVCDVRTTERVVAVGDVHGAYDQFVGILRAAGLLDARDRWSGGRAILVQTGDVLDRGPDSRKALDLLRRLERDAARAGGRVYPLLGNHELMRMVWDWRDVSAGELAGFRTPDSADLRERAYAMVSADVARRAREEERTFDEAAFREQFLKEIPLGYIEMRQAFAPMGDYGKWLREHHAVIRINGIVFLHGGISAATAGLGCAGINEAVRRDLTVENPTAEQVLAMLSSSETGPLWYRGLALEPDPAFAPEVTKILGVLGAQAIVIGHTVTAGFRIATRFDGRVIQIDTGMLGGAFFPGGMASALEIRGDALTAIYQKGRERLSVPAPVPAPQ
jgi:calcineurin-like phosphoesterase family protein